MTNFSLVIENLNVRLGGHRILEDLQLSVDDGQFVAIIGTSGGGKTTLLRTVAGLLEAEEGGRIVLHDEPILGPEERVAMVFQNFGLFPWKTVRENIRYGLDVQGRKDTDGRVDRLLELMHLADAHDSYPYQLSGGMKQRVGIARALCMEPRLLLLDEPFSAVDAITREELQGEVLQLWERQSHMNALLVTHDLDEAVLMADRVIVLCHGQVVLDRLNPIERPRNVQTIRSNPEYARLRGQLWNALKEADEPEAAPPIGAAR